MDDYKIALGALLDANAKGDIDKQLNAIKDLSVTISKATLSNDVINDIKRQLTQNGIDLKLVFGNVNQITNQAKQTGQQIGKLISDSAEQAINDVSSQGIGRYFKIDSSTSNQFRREMEKLVSEWTNAKGKLTDINIQTRTSYDKDADENITRLHQATVTYKNELNEVIKKTIAWRQIGTTTDAQGNEKVLRGFVEVAGQYSKSLDTASTKTDTFVDKQKQAVSNLKNTLSTIESKFNDKGASKHLTDTTHIADVQKKIGEVNSAITTLQNSNKSTFTQAKTDVERLITELNNLITQYQNAEYAATSLRTKDINTIKTDESNKLDAFIEKMKQSGHYTSDLESKANTLKTDLQNVFDTNSLTKYLNSLSNLQSEFKKVDEAAKTSEKNTKIQTNVEAEKKILEVYINQLKEAGVYAGDVKTKIEGMLSSLANVNGQNGLTTWRAELKGVKAETDAVLKSVQSSSTKEQDAYEVAYKELKKLYDLKIEYAKLGSNKETDFYYGKAIADQEKVWRQAWSKTSEPDNWNVQKRNELHREELVLQDKLAQAYGKTANARKQAEDVNKIQLSTDITKIENDYKRFGIVSQEVENNLKELKIARENALKAEGTDRASAEIEKYNQKLAETKSSWKELQATQVSVNQRTSQMTEMQEWMRKNKNATKLCGDQVERLIKECQTCDKVRFDQIKNEFKELQVEAGKAGKLGNTLFGGIIEQGKKFIQWSGVTGAVMTVSNKVREAVDELKDLDDILTEITKTSDLTEQQLVKLGDSAYDTASKYGRTASDYLTGVQEMYRSGFSNAEEMAELSILAQSAGDMDKTLSNDYLLATNAAYKYKGSIEELNKVLDSQNYITNNAAISMKDIADATTETASVAAQYGVQIDELSALIATATANTRESGSEVGTALKAILINLQDTTSKPVTETFDALGISMTKVENGAERLKTPIELIHELADAYNSLPEGDIMRANILNEIGQKRHANVCVVI